LNAFGSRAYWGLVYLPDTTPDPPPRLSLRLAAANTVQISWPSAAGTNWSLCSQQSLGATNAWTVVTNPPALAGANYVVTETCNPAACFYRLEKQ
jgi:hypothetical protein